MPTEMETFSEKWRTMLRPSLRTFLKDSSLQALPAPHPQISHPQNEGADNDNNQDETGDPSYNSSSSFATPSPSDILPTPSAEEEDDAFNRSRSSIALIGRCRSDKAKLMNPLPSPPPVDELSELAVAEGLWATDLVPETDEKNWWCEISDGGDGIATGREDCAGRVEVERDELPSGGGGVGREEEEDVVEAAECAPPPPVAPAPPPP